MTERTNIKALSKEGVSHFIGEIGSPRYRANQLLHWVYQKYASEIKDITEFSNDLRDRLGKRSYISNLNLIGREKSEDGTEKFLFSLEDGETIESVLIPEGGRLTLCVSSQVGCAMGCRFCLTGTLGLIRNLKTYEIVDQIISINRLIRPVRRITNVVLMGMGEPLANFDEVTEALRRITEFIGISKRKITLSTAGLAPKIISLAEKAPEINLAVSLNATTDAARSEIMPINKKYPLKPLIDACRKFPLSPRRRITFEYVLISGMNDSAADAERLVNLLRGLRCKINLIPLNPHSESALERPPEKRILEFQKILVRHNLTALVRESKGRDISAACGQLKAAHRVRS
jgi:23S rRNA (adenine2503-C2)-methyltransferase